MRWGHKKGNTPKALQASTAPVRNVVCQLIGGGPGKRWFSGWSLKPQWEEPWMRVCVYGRVFAFVCLQKDRFRLSSLDRDKTSSCGVTRVKPKSL